MHALAALRMVLGRCVAAASLDHGWRLPLGGVAVKAEAARCPVVGSSFDRSRLNSCCGLHSPSKHLIGHLIRNHRAPNRQRDAHTLWAATPQVHDHPAWRLGPLPTVGEAPEERLSTRRIRTAIAKHGDVR